MMGRMKGNRPQSLSVVAVVVGPLLYFGGYVMLSERMDNGDDRFRFYSSAGLATFFWPGAEVETLLRGKPTYANTIKKR